MSSKPTIWLVNILSENFLLPGGIPPHPPMGGLYLASALRKEGWDPKVLHLLPGHVKALYGWMESEKPDIMGFTVLIGPTVAATLLASQYAKKLGIPVIWGGVHASMTPEVCLKEAADYVVLGEGEETIVGLADAIKNGADPGEMRGVAQLEGEKLKCGPTSEPVENLDDYPPAWDLMDPNNYIEPIENGASMPFIFSRACPYRCRFCYNETIRAGKWKRHSDEYLADTLDYLLKRSNFSVVNFNDDFLFDTSRKSTSWMEVLAKRNLKWVASFRSKSLTPDLTKWIEEMGCVGVRVGMESGHPDTLKLLAKRLNVEDHYTAIRALAETSMSATVGFVINWPGETRESIVATMKVTDDLARLNPRVRYNLGYYIPMPGTPIFEEALDEGLEVPKTLADWNDIFNHPYRYRGFSKHEIEGMELISGRLYRHYIKPWPMQWLIEPAMRWRFRHGKFKWFAIAAMRRLAKKLTGHSAKA